MSEPFIAEIRMWGCEFAPRNWAFCNGQLLSISSNTALFSIIGTQFGGDGRTTMGLPNLEDRAPMQFGRGPGLTDQSIGRYGGADQVSLTEAQLPAHDHVVRAVNEGGSSATPTSELFMGQDQSSRLENISYVSTETVTNTELASEAISQTGAGKAHENQQPFLNVNFCIALLGLYPSRS